MTLEFCTACGQLLGDDRQELTATGLIEKTHVVHRACGARFLAGLEERRRQFDELIAAGASRDEANRIMIARIEGKEQN